MLRVRAPAKVNLRLRVLAREGSGYHQLETIFAALEFGDTLTVSRTEGGVELTAEGPSTGPVQENLVHRAAVAFLDRGGVDGGVRIHLEKRIPVGGGLGGGSSDAAAALRGLQALFPGALTPEEVLGIAGDLGSDVPFFLCGSPFALAWGRGDRLLPLPPPPPAPVLLAIPPVAVPTAEAYRLLAGARNAGGWNEAPGEAPRWSPARVLGLQALSSWDGLSTLAENDFEEVILPRWAPTARLREALDDTNPLFALLSGSGACLFAVYRGAEEASRGKARMEERFPETGFVLTRTLGGSSPAPQSRARRAFPTGGVERQ